MNKKLDDPMTNEQNVDTTQSVIFGVVIEFSESQRVRCEDRNGIEVFVFDSGYDTKTVVQVETYMAILEMARSNKSENSYGIPNHELV